MRTKNTHCARYGTTLFSSVHLTASILWVLVGFIRWNYANYVKEIPVFFDLSRILGS